MAVGVSSPAPQSHVVPTLTKQRRAHGHLSLDTSPRGGLIPAYAYHLNSLAPCTKCPQTHLSAHQQAVRLLFVPLR